MKITHMKLGLGGGAIGNLYQPITDDTAEKTIQAAWEKGIRYFDTAPYYGYGLSEIRFGKALGKLPRHDFILSTKVGRVLVPSQQAKINDPFPESLPFTAIFDYSYKGIMRSFHESLARLNTCPDIIYLHDLGYMTHGNQHVAMLNIFFKSGYRALEELQCQYGVAIGLGVNEVDICLEIIPRIHLDIIMLAGRYTLLEQGALTAFFPLCNDYNIAVAIAGPYNSGILVGGSHYNYLPAQAHIVEQVTRLKAACLHHQIELAHAAIQYPSLHPQVISTVFGAGSVEEVNVTATNYNKLIDTSFWQFLMEENLIPRMNMKKHAKNSHNFTKNLSIKM